MNSYLGSLFIIAAPSGGGKTSLVKKLIQDMSQIEVSISHTTREVRSGERDGIDYFFINKAQFLEMAGTGAFVEHAQVFNNFYGTSFKQIEQRLQSGIDIVLDIDWQGAQQIKERFSDAVGVFVIPPSLETLKTRLQTRQRDNEEIIHERMLRAQDELSHFPEFDYLIVNDDFEKAASELQAIVTAHRLRIARQAQQQRKLLSFLLSSQ